MRHIDGQDCNANPEYRIQRHLYRPDGLLSGAKAIHTVTRVVHWYLSVGTVRGLRNESIRLLNTTGYKPQRTMYRYRGHC